MAYKAELGKLVEAEAARRGEGTADNANGEAGGSLLDNADAIMKKNMDDEARSKLEAARANGTAGGSVGVLQPSAKLASQMAGAKGRLATPTSTPPVSGGLSANGLKSIKSSSAPTSTGGPKLVLRKPTTATASSRFMKKSSSLSTTSKLRVNKITDGDNTFEDVETTQKNIENQKKADEEEKKRREEEDAKLARELQEQLNGLGNGGEAAASSNGTSGAATPASRGEEPATPTPTPASGTMKTEPPAPKVSKMEENMNKLIHGNSDFFSGM